MSHGEKGHRDCHHDQRYFHYHGDCDYDCDATFTAIVITIILIVMKIRSDHSNPDQPSYVGRS